MGPINHHVKLLACLFNALESHRCFLGITIKDDITESAKLMINEDDVVKKEKWS